jgi:hypothetical protein
VGMKGDNNIAFFYRIFVVFLSLLSLFFVAFFSKQVWRTVE